MTVTRRGTTFHLRKRIPRRFLRVDDRAFVWVSLHTDSESHAKKKAAVVWAEMIEAWEAKLAGAQDDGEERMAAARSLAARRGFRFLLAPDVARLPIGEILDRAEKVVTPKGRIDKLEAAALLGGAKPPLLTVTKALKRYWNVSRDQQIGKSEDQIRRWKNPRKKAVANFIEALGADIPIQDIGTRELFQFREWWIEKMADEGLTANSANKDFIHLVAVLRAVARPEEIDLRFDTKGLNLKEKAKGTRPPFSENWIRERLLAPNALDGLNDEARDILLMMLNTGARPSELAALTGPEIRTEDPVPHVSIEGLGRELKTVNAKRKIPLIGVSLEAARRHPNGFPRYADNPGLSDTINKFLRENHLLETPQHSLYGLRHAFEDRMLRAGIDNRIRADLMGHALQRERYGAGGGLEHVHAILLPISF